MGRGPEVALGRSSVRPGCLQNENVNLAKVLTPSPVDGEMEEKACKYFFT